MTDVQVVVPEGAAGAVRRELGRGDVQVVTRPAGWPRRRLFLYRLGGKQADLLGWAAWASSQDRRAPLVILVAEGSPIDAGTVQRIASVESVTGAAPYVAPDAAAARRVALAHRYGAEERLIASVLLSGAELELWTCEPRLRRVPIASVPALARLDRAVLGRFEISGSGSRIRWPDADLDLDLEALLAPTDPAIAREQRRTYARHARAYGRAIQTLRRSKGLTQAGVPGIGERTMRRIETGETLPRADTLRKLALAHGLDLRAYLAELARRSAPPRR